MAGEYKVGSLSNLIQQASKTKKKKSSDKELTQLAALFASPPKKVKPQKTKNTLSKTSDVKLQKNSAKTKSGSPKKIPKGDGFDPPPGVIHEALLQNDANKSEEKGEENKPPGRKPRHKNRRDRTKDPRTIFVGNLPLAYDKKQLKKLFKSCGKIESVRFRCAPPENLKLPKRAIAITKSFHKERNNIVSYICFEEEESAKKALKINGREVDGFHIRVDISNNAKKHEKTNTVFVGNMTYDITENEVWNHFEDCGEIENVRIIRDNKTGMGKGIGYIQFKDKDGVEFGLKLHQSSLKGREIRVMRCDAKTAKKQKEKMINKMGKKHVKPSSNVKKLSFRSTNKKTDPFKQGSKEKRRNPKKTNKHKHLRLNEKSKDKPRQKKMKKSKDKIKKGKK